MVTYNISQSIQGIRKQPAKYSFILGVNTDFDKIGLQMGCRISCSIVLVNIDESPFWDVSLGYL